MNLRELSIPNIFLTLFVVIHMGVYGQNNLKIFENTVELGGIAGINISNIVGADVSGNSSRIGVHLGGYGQVEMKNKFGLRTEIHLLSIKGTSSGGFRTFYIDAPILGSYQVDEKIKLLAGIQPSILLNARVSDGRGNITSDIRTIDIGFVFGGWYQITKEWGLGVRYVPGLSRVGASGQERTFNSNIQLSIGYRFL